MNYFYHLFLAFSLGILGVSLPAMEHPIKLGKEEIQYNQELLTFEVGIVPRTVNDDEVAYYWVHLYKNINGQNQLVGYIIVQLNETIVTIEAFWIHPDLRGNGYGTLFIRQLMHRLCNTKNYTVIWKAKPSHNLGENGKMLPELIKFYKKFGGDVVSHTSEHAHMTFHLKACL